MIKKSSSIGAAAFAMGLYLACPHPVGIADEGGADSAAASSVSGASGIERSKTSTARSSRAAESQAAGRRSRSAPVAADNSAVIRGDAIPRAAAAVPRVAAVRTSDAGRPKSIAPDLQAAAAAVARQAAAAENVSGSVVAASADVPGDPADELRKSTGANGRTAAATVEAPGDALLTRISQAPFPRAANQGALTAAQALDAAVTNWFDSSMNWLAGLPANPVADFLTGALLMIRRNLFSRLPEVIQTQTYSLTDGVATGTVFAVDPEEDPLTFTVVSGPQLGTVELTPGGKFVYTTNEPVDETFTDIFTVEVADNGFSLLDPFSDRTVEVQIFIGRGQLLQASQGFDIINLTNEVLWVNGSWIEQWGNSTYYGTTPLAIQTCEDQGFCLTSKVNGKADLRGTALQPGASLHAEISTPLPFFNPSFTGQWVQMDFQASDGRKWLVEIQPTYSNSTNRIDGSWSKGGGGVVTGQPFVLDPTNSRRLLLIDSPGTVRSIGPDDVWTGTPPASCSWCTPIDPLNPLDVLRNFLALKDKFSSTVKAVYDNVTFIPFGDERATATRKQGADQPLRLTNLSGSAGNSTTYDWSVTSDPGPQPSAPWWQKYAAQGAEALAKFLLGKFVGDGIANAASKAIGSALSPEEVKTGETRTGSTTLVARPYSVSILVTSAPKYDVIGDVLFSGPTGSNGFAFKAMEFQIIDRRGTYNAEFRMEPVQLQPNQGFELVDRDLGERPNYVIGSENLLKLSAFKGGGSDGAVPEDFSARGCSASVTTNCTTFTVSDQSVAAITVESGRAVLSALKAGQTEVTATYRWSVPKGGFDGAGNPLPPETGSVVATMSIRVSA